MSMQPIDPVVRSASLPGLFDLVPSKRSLAWLRDVPSAPASILRDVLRPAAVSSARAVLGQILPRESINDAPVFVIAPHRSRSTLLQRILNAHPDLVVWGEHGGLINKLAELDATAAHFWNVDRPLRDRNIRAIARKVDMQAGFDPWTTPWDRPAFRTQCRSFLRRTFRTGLHARQRWGLKEIRYNSPEVCGFLATLFPAARFVIVRRDSLDLVRSSILCAWSAQYLNDVGAGDTPAGADAVVADCTYAVAATDWQLDRSRELLGANALELASPDIAPRAEEVFAFVGLRLTPAIRARVESVIGENLGGTDTRRTVGLIDRAFIDTHGPAHLDAARNDIAANGLDLGRLRRTSTRGAFSFLIGDHDVRDTTLSTMFW